MSCSSFDIPHTLRRDVVLSCSPSFDVPHELKGDVVLSCSPSFDVPHELKGDVVLCMRPVTYCEFVDVDVPLLEVMSSFGATQHMSIHYSVWEDVSLSPRPVVSITSDVCLFECFDCLAEDQSASWYMYFRYLTQFVLKHLPLPCRTTLHFPLYPIFFLIYPDSNLQPLSCCRAVYLQMCRGFMRRHDFQALVNSQWTLSWTACCGQFPNKRIDLCLLYDLQMHGYVLPLSQPLGVGLVVSKVLSVTCLTDICHTSLLWPDVVHDVRDCSQYGAPSVNVNVGGGRAHVFSYQDIMPYAPSSLGMWDQETVFTYIDHITESPESSIYDNNQYVVANVPLLDLVPHISVAAALKIARHHKITIGSHVPKKQLPPYFEGHCCSICPKLVSIFLPNASGVRRHGATTASVPPSATPVLTSATTSPVLTSATTSPVHTSPTDPTAIAEFPPPPLTQELNEKIISEFCADSTPDKFQEAGCAVCGQLTPISDLSRLKHMKGMLGVLEARGVTRVERKTSKDPVREYRGPVLDHRCDKICRKCRTEIRKGRVPNNALAQGLWLGEVPAVLSDLRFIEKLLIARLRHNCCFVRVASGLRKMTSHVVAFQAPIPKLYRALPPPVEDMDEVLAILFTGPTRPTQKDFERTPLLVRRNAVAKALEWLKLNHADYKDIDISYDNLAQYPEDDPPVTVEFRQSDTNKYPENTSVFDDEKEDGTQDGECPFVVHGLTGENLDTMTSSKLKGLAMSYLNNGGKMLAVGHSSQLASIYNNPQYYPQMFPWLFPYGVGGIGSTSFPDTTHKRFLLMYHDKRFQKDVYFPFVAFSHSQIKSCSSGAFIMAERKNFHDITNRILGLDQAVLQDVATRMSQGEIVKPQTQQEKDCFQVIRDLDHVGQHVEGSVTSKKYMRSEIWSLMAYYGAPSWYITLSPADVRHPICLYFADTNETFSPDLRAYDERIRLIAGNPVAGARFFHFMVELFIQHVLGVGTNHPGLYGETSAYYGTVEQQGRLTLHLHLLLWLRNNLSPQEIRERILDANSDFQQRLIEYLESVHVGEFFSGTQSEVQETVSAASKLDNYTDPTQTLPTPPPKICSQQCGKCSKCEAHDLWQQKYKLEVDDLLLKSNVHRCSDIDTVDKSKVRGKQRHHVGCIDIKTGNCKARFPREICEQTVVDPETGSINMKKLEPRINTISPALTYLMRCNTDVTSLKSGTAIKAVIMYVTDYITKCSLKTHVMFDIIKSTYSKNSDLIGGSETRHEKARKLVTKMVNTISAKLEMGSPMACMYLLKNPDHYTNCKFAPVYWRNYVLEARRPWNSDTTEDNSQSERVTLVKRRGQIMGLSPITDYVDRPKELESMCLYDWVSRCKREKIPPSSKQKSTARQCDSNCESDRESESASETDFSSDPDISDIVSETFISDKSNSLEQSTTLPLDMKSIPTGLFEFQSRHPLHSTHRTRCVSVDKALIPNFIGETLPRRDTGDCEWYCATMLTLFSPWRSGLQLKTQEQSWDDAFMSFKFSSAQLKVMDYFNLRYECMDARDDFAKQKKESAVIVPGWNESGELSSWAHSASQDDAVAGVTIEEIDMDVHQIGKRELNRRKNMSIMNDIMTSTGWTEARDPIPMMHVPPPETIKTGPQWKAAVKEKRQEIMDRRSAQTAPEDQSKENCESVSVPYSTKVFGEVKIVDKSYLERHHHSKAHKSIIDPIVKDFQLNREQERAFCIVAHHACNPYAEQLKMYLGGMGGTEKTQVLKALIQFFKVTNQSHRFVVVAPTGSAAALLGGSTYHYLFGFNERPDENLPNKTLLQLRARFEGVDYIFFDKVSMLSCYDMYRISARLAKILNVTHLPFGGMSMVFAGDFAQLPPAIGQEHASLYSRTVGKKSTSLRDQEAAIGKALWHQVTTTVIL